MPESTGPTAQPNPNEGADIIKNIVATETGEANANILAEAPELDASLLRDVAPPKSLALIIFKSLFGLLLLIGLASVTFFTSQLTDKFNFLTSRFDLPNLSKEVQTSNFEVVSLQTDLNFYRYLQAKAYLDHFSFDGDSFLQNYLISTSQTSSRTEKNQAINEITALRPRLKEAFLAARDNYTKPFTAPLVGDDKDSLKLTSMYQEELRAKLQQKAGGTLTADKSKIKPDIKNYLHTQDLIGNSGLKSFLLQTDFDALTDQELYMLIKQVNSLIVNNLSTIQELKESRIKWSDIMNEIDLRTIAVDSHYSENFYEDLGGIRYNSYDFDSVARQISIVGETKRIDTQNFTMIADLIDELNRSDLFKNGEMRSFNKTGSLEDGYTATLKLILDLEEGTMTENTTVLEVSASKAEYEAMTEYLLNP